MKIEEAISYLRMATDEARNEEFSDVYKEMCSMSINALKKQIPQKTIIRGLGQRYCPVCRYGGANSDFCSKCGQKLEQC